jgi:hypothetical protein
MVSTGTCCSVDDSGRVWADAAAAPASIASSTPRRIQDFGAKYCNTLTSLGEMSLYTDLHETGRHNIGSV